MTRIDTLHDWIAAATSGLPKSAAGKFAAEIADHVAAARGKHIEAGTPEADADRAALDGLGEADAVARTFRDAHFSRREYTGGMLASLALLGLIGAMLAYTLSPDVLRTQVVHDLLATQPGDLPKLAAALALAALFLRTARAGMVFLSEQADARPPRWGFAALVGAAGVWIAPKLAALALLLPGLMPGPGQPVTSTLSAQIWLTCTVVSLAGALAIGPLLAGLCLAALARGGRALPPVGGALLALAALAGLQVAAAIVAALFVPLDYGLARFSALTGLSGDLVATAYSAPTVALAGLLLWICAHMRRPGAALAA